MRRKFIVLSIISLFIIMISNICYGVIEVKPAPAANANNVLVNVSVSNSYLLSRGMTGEGESLEGATVLPHLTTNADWAAVSYLSQSIYGTNGAGKNGDNNAVKITMNGVDYYSTNANPTGVMNWGFNPYKGSSYYTQTASLISNYDNASTARDNVVELEKNLNTRYVETVPSSNTVANTRGMGFAEGSNIGYGQWTYFGTDKNYPVSLRNGLFRFMVGSYYNGSFVVSSGIGSEKATFRPVIWNK